MTKPTAPGNCICPGWNHTYGYWVYSELCPYHGHLAKVSTDKRTARMCLIENLANLTYAAAANSRFGGNLIESGAEDLDDVEFLDALSQWVLAYGEAVSTVRTAFAETSSELVDYRTFGQVLRRLVGTQ
jgi:hypothetical protein